MDKTKWERLFELWNEEYYTKFILLFCIIIALIIGIKFYRKEKTYISFLLYISLSLIFFLALPIIYVIKDLHGRSAAVFDEVWNTVFALVEFIIFYYFFLKILNAKIIKLLMRISFLPIFILSSIFFIKITDPEFSRNQIIKLSFQINIVEFFLLLIPCLIYFYELFTKEASQILSKSPAFWITTGIFIYCVVSLPFLLIGDNLAINYKGLYHMMYGVHYISFSFLFISFAKAFLCKTTLTI